MQIGSNWKYKHIQLKKSVSVTSFTYVESPIVTKVSVLSNLRISGRELKDNHYLYIIHFVVSDKVLPLYRHFSDFFTPNASFLSLMRASHFTQFEKGNFRVVPSFRYKIKDK